MTATLIGIGSRVIGKVTDRTFDVGSMKHKPIKISTSLRLEPRRDAVDFAANAIDEATYAMLDAILARKT